MKNNEINNVIGIDTIALSIENFQVNDIDNSQLIVNQAPVNSNGEELYSNLLWIDLTGNRIYGKSAYYNSTALTFNIYPRKNKTPSIKLKYTPGKILYQNNYETVNIGELRRATDQAQSQIILDTGVRADLEHARITRIDIQVTMEFKESLAPLFDVLKSFKEINRLKQKYAINQSICWGNKQKALCIYNKSIKDGNYTLSSGYRNALRIEYRLMSHKAIRDKLKVTNISQLTQSGICTAFLDFIKPVITRLKPKLHLTAKGTLQQKFDLYKENNNCAKFRDYIYDVGIHSLLKSHGINEMIEIVKESSGSNSSINRLKKKINKIDQNFDACKNIKAKTNLFDILESNLFGDKGAASDFTGTLLCT